MCKKKAINMWVDSKTLLISQSDIILKILCFFSRYVIYFKLSIDDSLRYARVKVAIAVQRELCILKNNVIWHDKKLLE